MKFHSQIGQDVWLVERALPGKREGYFVDVGAFDGLQFSNTATLEQALGWGGVCIEAAPAAAAVLRKNRMCHVVEALVDGEKRDRLFAADRGMLSHAFTPGADQTGETVRSHTLASILKEVNAPAQIDYLSMDIEGSELDALRRFPFDRYAFDAITIEAGRQGPGELFAILTGAGYVRVGVFFGDWFFRRQGVANADQDWIDNVLARRIDPRYWGKPEMAHIPWVAEWKRRLA